MRISGMFPCSHNDWNHCHLNIFFLVSLAKLKYLPFLISFILTLLSASTMKSTAWHVIFLLLLLNSLFWPGLGEVFKYEDPIGFYVSFSWEESALCLCSWYV